MKTEEEEVQERSLADLVKERPGDFNFDDITDVVPGRPAASVGTSATLTQILGGFEFFRRDPVSGLSFYGRKPKVAGLQRLIDVINLPVDEGLQGIDVINAVMHKSCAIAAHLLYVQGTPSPVYGGAAGDSWRRATAEEIGEAFDLGELTEIRDRFSGLTVAETPGGNAPIHPTTEPPSA